MGMASLQTRLKPGDLILDLESSIRIAEEGGVRDLYVSTDQVEAFGWVSIAWHELEVVLSILVLAISDQPGDKKQPFVAFPESVTVLRSRVSACKLRVEWRRPLGEICKHALSLSEDYASAARAVLYVRGGGALENLIRDLADRTRLNFHAQSLTTTKTTDLEFKIRELSRSGAVLAQDMLSKLRL